MRTTQKICGFPFVLFLSRRFPMIFCFSCQNDFLLKLYFITNWLSQRDVVKVANARVFFLFGTFSSSTLSFSLFVVHSMMMIARQKVRRTMLIVRPSLDGTIWLLSFWARGPFCAVAKQQRRSILGPKKTTTSDKSPFNWKMYSLEGRRFDLGEKLIFQSKCKFTLRIHLPLAYGKRWRCTAPHLNTRSTLV